MLVKNLTSFSGNHRLKKNTKMLIGNCYHEKYTLPKDQGSIFLYIAEESTDSTPQFEASQKDTRMTFHPVYELPMMRKWFQKNRNPTEEVAG